MAQRLPLVIGSDGRPEQLQAGDQLNIPAHFGGIGTATDGATVTFDLSQTDKWEVEVAATRNFAVSNEVAGQTFEIAVKNNAGGAYSIDWWSGIRWPGDTVPTPTPTVGKEDVYMFRYRGSGDYRGYVVGQNQ